MKNFLKFSVLMAVLCFKSNAQSWHPDTTNVFPVQVGLWGTAFNVKFKPNGPMGKDWMYGGWLDQDSLRRCVAYREGGKWVPLPFSGYYGNMTFDLEMYEDTLYIGGDFQNIKLDGDSATLPNTLLLKWHADSLWTSSTPQDPGPFYYVNEMAVSGDSLLIWGGVYIDPQDSSVIETHFMTPDKGKTWQYPYSKVHPTDTYPDFGAIERLEILPNGHILTINNGSPRGSPFRGLSRWDGQQWHAYDLGISYGLALDFEFYKGDLYMGGSFATYETFYGDTIRIVPQNPGNSIVRWNGSQWDDVGNGILEGAVSDFIVHNNILYCHVGGGNESYHQFGDVFIPYLAGWNGSQWCGTPFHFASPPRSFGFIKDTLFASFDGPTQVSGDPVGYLGYYTGDYFNGPNSVCSTPGLGEEETLPGNAPLQVFPVPAKGEVQVSLPEEGIQNLKVYDLSGRCVLGLQPEAAETAVDISGLVPGVYLLEVNGKYRRKVVKE